MSTQGEFLPLQLEWLYDNTREKNPFQRVISENKVDIIVNGLLEEEKILGYIVQTGIIHIAKSGDKWYIIDGQHRLSAYYKLGKPTSIWTQVWKYDDLSEMLKKFRDINNNSPIEEYITKAAVDGTSGLNEKEKYDKLIRYVESNYKQLIKYSDRPQWPNINGERFRKLVNHIPELKGSTIDNIIDKFEELNMKCKSRLSAGDKQERLWIKKTEEGGFPELYINRYMIDLWYEKCKDL